MKRHVVIVLAAILIIALWARGTFDHALVNIGLNAHRCARNGFGATFCGQELTEYDERVERVKQQGEAAQRTIKESSEKAQREGEALQQQAREASERAQEQLRRSTEAAP
jgi:Skp family chaperone for outer membrane proteins